MWWMEDNDVGDDLLCALSVGFTLRTSNAREKRRCNDGYVYSNSYRIYLFKLVATLSLCRCDEWKIMMWAMIFYVCVECWSYSADVRCLREKALQWWWARALSIDFMSNDKWQMIRIPYGRMRRDIQCIKSILSHHKSISCLTERYWSSLSRVVSVVEVEG